MRLSAHFSILIFLVTVCTGLFAACTGPISSSSDSAISTTTPAPTEPPTATPFGPEPTVAIPTEIPPEPKVWISPAVPQRLMDTSQIPENVVFVDRPDAAAWLLETGGKGVAESPTSSRWVFALVAAFPSLVDGVSLEDLRAAWRGERPEAFADRPLLVAGETKAAFESMWGPAGDGAVEVLAAGEMLDAAWQPPYGWAIVPFEELQPRWKVLRIDGQSPLDREFIPYEYPLTVTFRLTGPPAPEGFALAASNRDAHRLTVLVMTGTTALVRHTAARMEEMGIDYPAGGVLPWLSSADFTHISNEVPFYDRCPPAIPVRVEMRFCSEPEYVQLLETVGADIIELTGNHILDWGTEAFLDTLAIYEQHRLLTYGGGADLDKAVEPLVVEHNGNRLGFIGCNVAGPSNVWATGDRPGAAPCDFDAITETIADFDEQGILPIVTFQHFEVDEYKPVSSQRFDFDRTAAAGAAIVSGSQAHFPQGMALVEDSFIHYGLGNLFFDQMDMGRNRAFIDRHVFYAGQHISTELLTVLLEDSARPRPMTAEERWEFFAQVFSESGWEVEADDGED